MRNHVAGKILGLIVGMLFVAALAFGQITGDLQVNVSDQSGAAVAGATVTVRNSSTGFTREGTTDGLGQYRVAQLETGQYEVKVAHPGFTTVTQLSQVSSGGSQTVTATLN